MRLLGSVFSVLLFPKPQKLRKPQQNMPKTKFLLVRGPSLILALAAAKFPVKWISGQPPYPFLSPDRALVIARSGVYEGKVRHGRVYQMRESGQRSVNAPDFAFW